MTRAGPNAFRNPCDCSYPRPRLRTSAAASRRPYSPALARPVLGCLLVQFVLHPLCDLEHPFERAGLLARIWPDPPERLDITTLPLLSSEGRHQLGGVFVDGGFAEHLPGGGWRTHIEAARDGGPLRFPASSLAVRHAERR